MAEANAWIKQIEAAGQQHEEAPSAEEASASRDPAGH